MTWGKLSLLAASALTMVACQAAGQQPPATVTATPAASAPSAAKPVTYVALPDIYGQNAEIAKTKLEGLGLTKVELSSSNTKYSTVEQAKDWKVVGMEPGAGTVVKSDQPVIVKVVKVG
ncbi:MAG: PASTA domain-containing protein [Mycobacterium sp.]